MANFFSDAFKAIAGQNDPGQNTILGTNETLSGGFSGANSIVAPGLVAWNQALAPGITGVGINVANQLDPSILANFRGANQSIMNELALGGELPADVQQQVLQNALEGATASGFGASAGGRGLVARDLGLTSLDLRRQRQQAALAAGTSGLGVSKSFYDPATYTGLGADVASGISQDIRQVQAAKDELANVTEDIRRQNFSALLNTGGRIAGTVIGGVYGGQAGAEMGGQIGGSLVKGSRVGNRPQTQQGGGGGGFMSMLGGMFGKGGGGGGGGSENISTDYWQRRNTA